MCPKHQRIPAGDTAIAVKERPRTRRPSMYQVLLHNDDYTPMDFVVFLLITLFHKSETEATEIMWKVHRQGVGVAGIYPRQIAETKVHQVHQLAKENKYPLRSSMEKA